MSKIFLIRHGESIANTQSIYQGQTYDTDLSPFGFQQVRRLADRFYKIPIYRILASPLKRTLQTAQAVGYKKDIKVETEMQIIETNHGLWEGKHKDIIAKDWSEIYKKWQKFPSTVRFPQGEHFLDTQKRVVGWWRGLDFKGEKHVLVITHDNIIRILIAAVLNMKLNRIWKFHLQPTSVTIIEMKDNQPKLLSLNDASHLGELQANLAIHAL